MQKGAAGTICVIRGGRGPAASRDPEGWDTVESDRHFYMRRVTAERLAAARAVTEEARQRRMVLIEMYLQRLQAMPA